ncbi:MAG: response regulator, partial [Chitinivibrionales bacterium]|nr:response regulator [Chitinivibrionales bacterium]MBD3356544.1 response regulator [Chitinivibrionales bacterium]
MNGPASMPSILVVEDSLTQAEKLRYLLQERDYLVHIARNGSEALNIARRRKPAIVISDVVMPVMNGYDLCREIKADEELRGISVILLTALSDPQDVINGLLCGADNFITKPYSEQFLLSRIEHILVNKELRRAQDVEGTTEILYGGRRYNITADRLQIIDLLFSTFENAVYKSRELDTANEELTRTQRRLEELNEQLRRDIRERQRMEGELKRRADDLGALNRELEAFSYSVSHDLRAPLRSIMNFSTFIQEDYAEKLDDTGQDMLNRIAGGARKMSALIDDMLSLSRVSRQEMCMETVSLNELVFSIVEELREEYPERAVEIVVHPELNARADKRLLELALRNLVRNAWKYTRRNEYARIEIGGTQKDGGHAFFVKDNGV